MSVENVIAEILNSPSLPSFCSREKVDKVSSFRDKVVSFIDYLNLYTVDTIVQSIHMPIIHYMELEKYPWLKNKCVVGVFGHYSSGKSSFLNTILNLKLPENTKPSTALPTYIAIPPLGQSQNCTILAMDKNHKVRELSDVQFQYFDYQKSNGYPFDF